MGSNLGDRLATLRAAVRELDERGTKVVATSAVFECKALVLADADPQPEFLNAVIVLATELAAAELLERLLAIERAHGRVRAPGERWTARSLDLDLLAYVPSGATQSVELDEPTLVLPHPRAGERDFVLAPLAEVAPTLVLAGHTVADRLASLPIGARTVLRRLPDALR
ncbi:MAG TPA: 2-amino-4-hydroxy-6-hydroxymethyldihydropteridine diphosphokinase [Nannocystaceae bacterium]|nr:2-amino-4-hydroxy-6-hydroxymethyldihydropteridine diphosphokinase [Nannocystaceae bacterium]